MSKRSIQSQLPSSSIRKTLFIQALNGALICTVLALLLALSSTVNAQEASRQSFEMPAGELGSALSRFAVDTGVVIYFDASLTQNKNTAGLSGEFGVLEGLTQLLNGSGLDVVRESDGSYRVVDPVAIGGSVMTFDSLKVGGSELAESAYGPVDGYVATRSSTGSKTDVSLIETPRSISVVTADQLDAQGARSIDEALRYTAGIASEYRGIDKNLTDIVLRGFAEDSYVFIDGMRGSGHNEDHIDAYGLERIEVLKGPASILYGAGSPGGLVNISSKQPTEDFFTEVSIDTGGNNRKGGKLDINSALDDERKLLIRLTAVKYDGDSQVDFTEENRLYIAPALKWNVNDNTSLTILGKYQKDEGPHPTWLPAEGTVYANPNGQISTSFQIGEPGHWVGFDQEYSSLGYLLDHNISDVWSVHHRLRYTESEGSARSADGWGILDDGRTAPRGPFYAEYSGESFLTDSNVTGVFNAGKLAHKFLVGVDYKKTDRSDSGGELNAEEEWSIDYFNPTYGLISFPSPREILEQAYDDSQTEVTQLGLYIQDQVEINDLILNVGARFDGYESNVFNRLDVSTSKDKDDSLTMQIGSVYKFSNKIAAYASYSESFEPQSGTDFFGNEFEPTTGKQYEVGVKYQPGNDRSLITVSLFDIKKQNILTRDLEHDNFSVPVGEVESKGFEVEAKISINENFNLLSAYSYVDAKITESNTDDGWEDEGNRLGQTPENQVSIWADYNFQNGIFRGMRLNGGLRYIGSSLDYQNIIKTPSYTLLDVGINYDFNETLRGLSLSLTASNLTDKEYVSSCEGIYWCVYGIRREVTGSVKYRW